MLGGEIKDALENILPLWNILGRGIISICQVLEPKSVMWLSCHVICSSPGSPFTRIFSWPSGCAESAQNIHSNLCQMTRYGAPSSPCSPGLALWDFCLHPQITMTMKVCWKGINIAITVQLNTWKRIFRAASKHARMMGEVHLRVISGDASFTVIIFNLNICCISFITPHTWQIVPRTCPGHRKRKLSFFIKFCWAIYDCWLSTIFNSSKWQFYMVKYIF